MKITPQLFKGLFGIEKENIRVDNKGRYATTSHAQYFDPSNPFITRDFSEAQLEMITRPHTSIDEAYGELHNIQQVVLSTLDTELLWPQSNPPILPNEQEIPVANLEKEEERAYREYLGEKYGRKKSSLSGIHYNISFDDVMIQDLKLEDETLEEAKNRLYLKVAKYFLNYQWFFTYHFAASPIFHPTYQQSCVLNSNINEHGDCVSDNLISLRNSECGYKNDILLTFDYTSVDKLESSIQKHIKKENIASHSEIYENIRIKKDVNGNIQYLELRFIDINPYQSLGISKKSLEFLHLVSLYFMSLGDFNYSDKKQRLSYQKNIMINNFIKDKTVSRENLKEEGIELIRKIDQFYQTTNQYNPYQLDEYIQEVEDTLKDETKTLASKLRKDIANKGFINFHLEKANQVKQAVLDFPLNLKLYEDLELSTKIVLQASIKKGIIADVLDRKENFIKLFNPMTQEIQYVKQATKTSLDNYASVLLMENKVLTKDVLAQAKVSVPRGYVLHQIEDLDALPPLPVKLVVKPNNTNFGLGITILEASYTKKMLEEAVSYAFTYDRSVIIEEFISGLEYRFLVIDGKVEAVLHRRAANVVGDGVSTIAQLIEEKNQNPLRSKNYQTPLELIEVDSVLIDYLTTQKLNLQSIPLKDERVFLRENSNISTGGDSIDVTSKMHPSYKHLAQASAKALNVNITGVDMMVRDLSQAASDDNYAIIELNFNPAIHIHTYPLEGEGRDIGMLILDALFKKRA